MKKFYGGLFFIVVACVVINMLHMKEEDGSGFGMTANTLIILGLSLVWFTLCSMNIVEEWNRRPVLRLGKYHCEIGPGVAFVNPFVDDVLDDVNVYDEVSTIDVENVSTRDNVPLSFSLVLTTQVVNVRKSVVEVNYWLESVSERAKASANSSIRSHELSEIQGASTLFSERILSSIKSNVSQWGIEIKAIEIKHFKIVDEGIRAAIAMKARAQKEAEAELARAEMQSRIAEQLTEAASSFSEAGWRLKSLETLLELCRSANNNTILIPSDFQSLAKVLVSNDFNK